MRCWGGGDGDNENESLVTRIAYSRPVPKFVHSSDGPGMMGGARNGRLPLARQAEGPAHGGMDRLVASPDLHWERSIRGIFVRARAPGEGKSKP